jgi:uncharacterized membrane protein YdbT with pleckstrin-like domain
MAPSAEPAAISSPLAVAVPARLLEDGEIVILAIKPSGWFVVLSSFPVLVAAAAVAAVVHFTGEFLGSQATQRAVLALCVVAACVRVLVGALQWMSRLYVLTDRRVIRVRGVLHEEVCQRLLRQIANVTLAASAPERLMGVGSLYLDVAGGAAGSIDWTYLARPGEVRQIVADAVSRAK